MNATTNQQQVPLMLAPLAGYSNLPFRLMAKKYGADTVTTEMISAKGLFYRDKKTAKLMATCPEEAPAGIQLFGSDPAIIERVVAEQVNATPFAFIDFNAGCPAPKIVKNGDGAALLKDLSRLEAIVRRMKVVSIKPVHVKIRLGWDAGHRVAVEAAKRIEAAGADVLTVHGRTREAFYSGAADWPAIAEVKAAVSLPVVANGDIDSPEAAAAALAATGADGLMVGRGAIGNPFIFREMKQALAGKTAAPPSVDERLQAAVDHVHLVTAMAERVGPMVEMRKQLVAYTRGMPGSAALRQQIFTRSTGEALLALLEAYREAQSG
ncbi:tRNA dihydrouridine synthase DusB [Pseudoramibacter alactolyticus]|uniref:tRNA dihydrouridine synthase DusB n=1 Tax=Pseudoramibacter alactolyticus TaxID=113287 RepID=UPI0028EBC40D|nr:tRNA dihydrouridine synthase DusB [Pseudoramibacter alactolyticus]